MVLKYKELKYVGDNIYIYINRYFKYILNKTKKNFSWKASLNCIEHTDRIIQDRSCPTTPTTPSSTIAFPGILYEETNHSRLPFVIYLII